MRRISIARGFHNAQALSMEILQIVGFLTLGCESRKQWPCGLCRPRAVVAIAHSSNRAGSLRDQTCIWNPGSTIHAAPVTLQTFVTSEARPALGVGFFRVPLFPMAP